MEEYPNLVRGVAMVGAGAAAAVTRVGSGSVWECGVALWMGVARLARLGMFFNVGRSVVFGIFVVGCVVVEVRAVAFRVGKGDGLMGSTLFFSLFSFLWLPVGRGRGALGRGRGRGALGSGRHRLDEEDKEDSEAAVEVVEAVEANDAVE